MPVAVDTATDDRAAGDADQPVAFHRGPELGFTAMLDIKNDVDALHNLSGGRLGFTAMLDI